MEVPKSLMRQKKQNGEKKKQSKMSVHKPVTLKELNCSCLQIIVNILLTKLSQSVWENLNLGCVYRPHCVRSSVKILPYTPTAQLIRAK